MAAGAEPLRLPLESMPTGLAAGDRLDDAAWAALARESAYALLMARALRLLERREHFAAELRRKLSAPGQDEALLRRVMARCLELGYLDDARALKLSLELFASRGGIGPARLRQLLFERGCPGNLIDSAVAEFAQHFDEAAETRALLEKRRRHFASRLRQLERREERRLAKAQDAAAKAKSESAADTEADEEADEFAAGRSPAQERAQRMKLRQQLAAAVLSFLTLRGLSGDAARRVAREFVDSLLSDSAGDDES